MTLLRFEIEIVITKDCTPKWLHTSFCQVNPPKHKQHVLAGVELATWYKVTNTNTRTWNWHVLIAHWCRGFLNSTLAEAVLFHSRESQKRHFATWSQSSQPKISQLSKPKRSNFTICGQSSQPKMCQWSRPKRSKFAICVQSSRPMIKTIWPFAINYHNQGSANDQNQWGAILTFGIRREICLLPKRDVMSGHVLLHILQTDQSKWVAILERMVYGQCVFIGFPD